MKILCASYTKDGILVAFILFYGVRGVLPISVKKLLTQNWNHCKWKKVQEPLVMLTEYFGRYRNLETYDLIQKGQMKILKLWSEAERGSSLDWRSYIWILCSGIMIDQFCSPSVINYFWKWTRGLELNTSLFASNRMIDCF